MTKELFRDIEQGPLWTFTANRKLSSEESLALQASLQQFISSWEAHGHPVVATFHVLDETVILIAADSQKSEVTGCSKDKMTHFFQAAGRQIRVDFFNRMLIPVLDEKRAIELVHWNDIEAKVKNGALSDEQHFIDATVTEIGRLKKAGFPKIKNLLVNHM